MLVAVTPDNASEVVFTPLGWVDGNVSPRLSRIDLQPALGRQGAFKKMAVVLTLAGTASICDPDVAVQDSRGCPPQ
jgi:type IV fimbrial biogenesis protein FimT